MKVWDDKETFELFSAVEDCKGQNKSLKFAFENHAQKFKRKPNSVRNYYYFEVKNLKNDEKRCKKLKINLQNHKKNNFQRFEKQQEVMLEQKILECLSRGESVRSACFKLANGDLKLMTRLQNKYQNTKRKRGVFLNKGDMLSNIGNEKIFEDDSNIIKFQDRQKLLTDADLNSLFLGIVKLVKKSAVEDFLEQEKKDLCSYRGALETAKIKLNVKEKQIFQLKLDNENLKNEIERLREKISQKNRNALKNRLQKNKIEKLKEES